MATGEATPAPSLSYPMTGGDGPLSYVHNSFYQKAALDSVKEKIKEAISTKFEFEDLRFHPGSSVFRIADFGCSVGPNTFIAIQNIIDLINLKHYQENTTKTLEFQVFFNDQANNDFNTLFKTLPSKRNYFAAGTPGSFYNRVMPARSLHFGHTSYTLHWLSEPPREISDRKSAAWNGNSIQCTNLEEKVEEAYVGQFKKDFGAFLDARAQEFVPCGVMAILGQCLPDGVAMGRIWKGVVTDIIGSCLVDMATMGKIEKEKVETFNLPIYFPQAKELTEAVEQNGRFTVEMFEKVSHPMENEPLSYNDIVSKYRAVFNGVIEEYFGEGIVDELFDLFAKKLNRTKPDFSCCEKDMQYFMLLKRKDY